MWRPPSAPMVMDNTAGILECKACGQHARPEGMWVRWRGCGCGLRHPASSRRARQTQVHLTESGLTKGGSRCRPPRWEAGPCAASRPSGCSDALLYTAQLIAETQSPQRLEAEKSKVSIPAAVVPGDAPIPGSQGAVFSLGPRRLKQGRALWVPYIRAPIPCPRAPPTAHPAHRPPSGYRQARVGMPACEFEDTDIWSPYSLHLRGFPRS